VDRAGTATADADKSDAQTLPLQLAVDVILHNTAFSETETVQMTAGDCGGGTHPCSSLKKFTTVCSHFNFLFLLL
jgi:hypothetical protein